LGGKIRLVLFDLDGVLVSAKDIHYEALNRALGSYALTREEHHGRYDGLTTRTKLAMLEADKGLPSEQIETIWERKQAFTLELFAGLERDKRLCSLFASLKGQGYLLGCCTNSIRRTALTALSKIGVIEYCDIILSNEDVKNPKPHPEIYWKAMSMMGCLPDETLIVEDNPHGLLAAARSRAEVWRVSDPSCVTLDAIQTKLHGVPARVRWKDHNLNVLIPMAGAGSRFEKAGYTFPKPLIEVRGKPMIQVVVENLGLDANYIFVVQKAHREKYNLDSVLNLIAPGCRIVEVDGLTEGAACTALLAREYIDNDQPLFFANSDQFVDWTPAEFMYRMYESGCDGGIVTFKATHPKWSFAKVGTDGYVQTVAEKNPISDDATVGFYYWKRGSDFVRYADSMIAKDLRVNGEFYVCPVFNEAIADGRKIRIHQAKAMQGLGTPEDLAAFLE
jgi:beta-phosphoglucomutase-like phosphatase (HAD superfamily)/dTDP-glucose pyrophosphorylase